MTRTDVVASSRPQAADVALMRRGSSRAWPRILMPVALSLVVALMASTTAFAAETTTGYSQTPPPPTTKTTPMSTAPTPTTGTSPSKESSTPTTATAPTTSTSPATTPSPTTAKSLPFTGFDLRWTVGIGIVLMGMGFSIVTLQRRQRRGTRR
jgi:negative regulator of sigma E activity